MATTFNLYDTWRKTVADPTRASAVAGSLKIAWVTGTYTPNQNTHEFFSSITNQVTGTNYTAGGNACASPTWTLDGSGNIVFDASDPAAWVQHASGFSNGRRAILYYDTGVAGTSKLVGYSNDTGADVGNVAANLELAFNASGIYVSPR